jgi:hypothetical protein
MGGEAPAPELVLLMQRAFPNLRGPTNAYGPTEATVAAVHHTFPRGGGPIVIGRPDANVHAYVVDTALRPVPLGVPGELLLSGPRLALGYVGRPDLTAEAFVPNPCLALVADRLEPALAPYYERAYRTGDLVRWRADGTLDFLGRIDRQVKVNGVRIELGEVEAALGGAPGVAQAAAVAVAGADGAKRLVGYVTPSAADAAAVIAHCRARLLPAMVPAAVVALDAFPLLPNGKVDAAALPEPDWEATGAEEYEAPADEVEAAVAAAFGAVLCRDAPVSATADFFEAGGDSMKAMRCSALIQEALGIHLPAHEIIAAPVVRSVAALIKQLLAADDDALLDAGLRNQDWGGSTVRPASGGQESLYLQSTVINQGGVEVRARAAAGCAAPFVQIPTAEV